MRSCLCDLTFNGIKSYLYNRAYKFLARVYYTPESLLFMYCSLIIYLYKKMMIIIYVFPSGYQLQSMCIKCRYVQDIASLTSLYVQCASMLKCCSKRADFFLMKVNEDFRLKWEFSKYFTRNNIIRNPHRNAQLPKIKRIFEFVINYKFCIKTTRFCFQTSFRIFTCD